MLCSSAVTLLRDMSRRRVLIVAWVGGWAFFDIVSLAGIGFCVGWLGCLVAGLWIEALLLVSGGPESLFGTERVNLCVRGLIGCGSSLVVEPH